MPTPARPSPSPSAPSPPLLLPAVEGRAAAETTALRRGLRRGGRRHARVRARGRRRGRRAAPPRGAVRRRGRRRPARVRRRPRRSRSPAAPGSGRAAGVPLAHTPRRLAARRGRVRGRAGRRRGPRISRRLLARPPRPGRRARHGRRLGPPHGQGPGLPRRRPPNPSTPPLPRRWPTGTPQRWPPSTRQRASGCWPPACPRGGRSAPRWPVGRSAPGCTCTTPRRSGSATWSPTGPRVTERAAARGRRRRPHRHRARPRWPSRSPSGWAARWSTPTRCSSTAAWTSAPPSPTSPSAAACRTTCSTCGTSARRPPSPSTGRRARAEIDRLRAAGVVPLLVGGSGLYVRAVLDELDFPGTDPDGPRPAGGRARRRRSRPRCTAGWPGSTPRRPSGRPAEQRTADRPRAGGHRADRRPVPRALPEPRPHYPAVVVGLDRAPAELDERVAVRVERMWAAGFVAEVEALAADGLREGPTASRALGYAQVLAQFDGALTARRGAGAHGEHHPPVRAPPAVVVPPRRGAHLVRRRAGPTSSTRSRQRRRSPYRTIETGERAATPRPVGPDSGTARRTTSSCCPTPTAPSGPRTGWTRRWSAGCATGAAGLGGDGVLRVVRSAHVPDAAAVLGADLDRLRVVHGPPQRRRLARGDVRQRHPAVPPRAGHRGPARPAHLRGRRARRHPRRSAPGRGDPRRRLLGRHGPGARRSGRARRTLAGPDLLRARRSRWAIRTWPALTDVDVDTLDLTRAARVRRRALPRGRQRRADQRARARRAHPAPGVRARRGGDPLLRHRRLRRGLRRARRRAAERGHGRWSTSPGAGCRSRSPPGTTVLTGPAVLVAAGALAPEWLDRLTGRPSDSVVVLGRRLRHHRLAFGPGAALRLTTAAVLVRARRPVGSAADAEAPRLAARVVELRRRNRRLLDPVSLIWLSSVRALGAHASPGPTRRGPDHAPVAESRPRGRDAPGRRACCTRR